MGHHDLFTPIIPPIVHHKNILRQDNLPGVGINGKYYSKFWFASSKPLVCFIWQSYMMYRTRTIISRGLYIFYPISKDHFFVFKEVFSENYVLMYGLYSKAAFNQERLMMARVRYIKEELVFVNYFLWYFRQLLASLFKGAVLSYLFRSPL